MQGGWDSPTGFLFISSLPLCSQLTTSKGKIRKRAGHVSPLAPRQSHTVPSQDVPGCSSRCHGHAGCQHQLHQGLPGQAHSSVEGAAGACRACRTQKAPLALPALCHTPLAAPSLPPPTQFVCIVWAFADVSFSIVDWKASILGFFCQRPADLVQLIKHLQVVTGEHVKQAEPGNSQPDPWNHLGNCQAPLLPPCPQRGIHQSCGDTWHQEGTAQPSPSPEHSVRARSKAAPPCCSFPILLWVGVWGNRLSLPCCRALEDPSSCSDQEAPLTALGSHNHTSPRFWPV